MPKISPTVLRYLGELYRGGALEGLSDGELLERFRAAVVLCDLEGLSYQQAAARLHVPLGTLQSRLARARKRLRIRLAERGFGALGQTDGQESAGVLMAAGAGRATPPQLLEQSTCRLCVALGAEPACLHTIVSSTVRVLIEKGADSMVFSRWSAIATVPIAATILCCGLFLNTQTKAEPRQDENRRSEPPTVVSKTTQAAPATAKSKALATPPLREQKAVAGRGKALVYPLDEHGDRIPDLEAVVRPVRRRRRSLTRPELPKAPDKEEIVDLAWVVVTGVVDHEGVQKSFGASDDGVPPAEQIYRRVDLQRQSQEGESWSRWRAVDIQRTYRVLDNLPEVAEERTDERFRVDNLVDPAPALVEGAWKGLDVDRLVPHLRDGKLVDPLKEFGQRNKLDRPPILVVRAFDFAAEPGKTYRYRARLVFWVPPEILRENGDPEVRGPWSEPTNAVTVP
jgi:Sigma-70, region 4